MADSGSAATAATQAISSGTGLISVITKDSQVAASLQEMGQQHKLGMFAGYELAWIVLIWVFRAWRLTKAGTLLTRIWTQAWIAVLFWIMALTSVPLLVWGGAYQGFLSQVIKLTIKYCFESA